MLEAAYVANFLGMIILPILVWAFFLRKLRLSWRLLLAGGLTFIASQIPHAPLTLALTPVLKSWGAIPYAIVLGLLAGIFEESARFVLFRFVLKGSRSWKHGIMVGLGHGGTEAILLGILAGFGFFRMLAYRGMDLSMVVPAPQLEIARQQVAAYWSVPAYMALLGIIDRAFTMCLHVALSTMVLYGVATRRPAWLGFAILWHAAVDGVGVYLGSLGALPLEAFVGVMAAASLVFVLLIRGKFAEDVDIARAAASDGNGRQGTLKFEVRAR